MKKNKTTSFFAFLSLFISISLIGIPHHPSPLAQNALNKLKCPDRSKISSNHHKNSYVSNYSSGAPDKPPIDCSWKEQILGYTYKNLTLKKISLGLGLSSFIYQNCGDITTPKGQAIGTLLQFSSLSFSLYLTGKKLHSCAWKLYALWQGVPCTD